MQATRYFLPALFAAAAFAQNTPRLEFEVASIRPSPPITMNVKVGVHIDGAQVSFTYVALKDLIQSAYKLKNYQVVAPDFVASDRYDIAAKLPAGSNRDQLPEMLQALLEDRFKLKFHRDSKEFPVYALIVAKTGLKLKEAAPDSESEAAEAAKGNVNVTATGGPGGVTLNLGQGSYFAFGDNRLECRKILMTPFADTLARFMDRPVVDMTGLTGRYDLKLEFTPEDYQAMLIRSALAAGVVLPPQALKLLEMSSGDSLGTALQTVGLKMESRKAPLPVLVVDKMEKAPTDN
jgi:uncharacterized protein (TIGR03435 family)